MPQSYSLEAGTWDAGSWATSGLQYRSLSVVGSYGSPFECPGYGSVRLPAVRGSLFAAPPAGRPSTILTIAVSGLSRPWLWADESGTKPGNLDTLAGTRRIPATDFT